jgi:hypothetical protein
VRITSTGQREMTDGDYDYRYTINIFLIRHKRPSYYDFHCIYCGKKVCELNGEVVHVIDIVSDKSLTNNQSTNRIRCNGRDCHLWYEFTLS